MLERKNDSQSYRIRRNHLLLAWAIGTIPVFFISFHLFLPRVYWNEISASFNALFIGVTAWWTLYLLLRALIWRRED